MRCEVVKLVALGGYRVVTHGKNRDRSVFRKVSSLSVRRYGYIARGRFDIRGEHAIKQVCYGS